MPESETVTRLQQPPLFNSRFSTPTVPTLTISGSMRSSLAKPCPSSQAGVPMNGPLRPAACLPGQGQDQLSLQLPGVGGADGVLADFSARSVNLFGDRRLENCLSCLRKNLASRLHLLVTDSFGLLWAAEHGCAGRRNKFRFSKPFRVKKCINGSKA